MDDIKNKSEFLSDEVLEDNIKPKIKLDYTLQTPEERNKLVKKIIDETPHDQLTNRYLEYLSDYIVLTLNKEEKKNKKILTDNRMVTVNKRETSFQGLACQLESGEDGIYNMIANDKNIIFTPKISITQKDIEAIPALKELRLAIEEVEKQEKNATGKRKFLLKKQLIEMRQDQYVIKNSYYQPISFSNGIKSFSKSNLNEKIIIEDNKIKDYGLISFFNPKHLSALLNNYSRLKEDVWGKFWTDAYYLMEDLDNLIDNTLKNKYPLYYDLLIYKIDGKSNLEIQSLLEEKHNTKYSVEYISSLWRNKIPKLLAKSAENEYITWYYTMKEKGTWKRCSKCGEIKLADNRFFSKNSSSKSGFYSICKECRNKKTKEKKEGKK